MQFLSQKEDQASVTWSMTMRSNSIVTRTFVLISVFGLGAASEDLPASEDDLRPSKVVLFSTGDYLEMPEGMSADSVPVNDWIAIPAGSCEILSTDIVIAPKPNRETGFHVETTKTEKSLPALLVHGLELKTGKFECSDLVRVGTHPLEFMGKDLEGNVWAYHDYQFKENLISVFPRLVGGGIDLVLKVNSEVQTLKRYNVGEFANVTVCLLGDLDRDGKVDVFLEFEQGGYLPRSATVLYLSGQAKSGLLVKEVVAMYTTPE